MMSPRQKWFRRGTEFSTDSIKEGASMSKWKVAVVAVVALTVVIVRPALAESGCKDGKFVGSYTQATLFTDIWGDGSGIEHTLVLQLTLHSDGTVHEEFSGYPDILLSAGTGTPLVGSWQCRQDGKLVVTTLNAIYVPTYDAALHGIVNTPVDLFLFVNSRTTRLFSVTDQNTLTRIQSRARLYGPTLDPTDPTGGTLRPLNTTPVPYKRLVASDADLLAP